MGRRQAWMLFGFLLIFISRTDLCSAGGGGSGAVPAHVASRGRLRRHHIHQRDNRDHQHDHHRHHLHEISDAKMLPDELAEEENEDVRLYGFSNYHYHDRHRHHVGASSLSGLGVWLHALGCSLLVSFASLICLIILPVIFAQAKPSKAIVDSLALFGAGAMLEDAFLRRLPRAFGMVLVTCHLSLCLPPFSGERSHAHDSHGDHSHHAHVGQEHPHSHAHSLEDLPIGLSILAGIVIFLLVEKVVQFVEDNSTGSNAWCHGHHRHHQTSSKKSEDIGDCPYQVQLQSAQGPGGKGSNEFFDDPLNGNVTTQHESLLRKRNVTLDKNESRTEDTANGSKVVKSLNQDDSEEPPPNLVFGHFNLFADGVYNFTDGMALESAFLLYGSVVGWSRTLVLLAHELPQEVGDFGILVRSGFSVSKALFFNLSALVALAGTAMALLWGQDPGQSSLIEGFTAGGFIYIAVAGALAQMNSNKPSSRSLAAQITSLLLGMAVALCISLVE